MDTIELTDLSQRRQPTQQRTQQRSDLDTNTFIQAAVLAALGLLLALFPGFVQYLAAERGSDTNSHLERFLSLHFGIYLLAFAVSLLLNTKAHPLLVPLTVASSLSTFLAYNTNPPHSFATTFFLANLILAGSGWIMILFPTEDLSKTTGADKRTSAFIFGNKSAASRIKKAWRRETESR
ncbi:hypothetical protein CC1G_04205 [Coprinopsis cinerea okayama7|uniref:Transmembrane protein n=1 Tax=Coprinopsis cinerea (strain Okayama-7 / 130 / ATCC MYA-4618 / FGSC 9003) TaxID=240176 RepID=A8NF89_COPC7|nr:hypothetical protein CC1G_04205 [Coprinopsis cinerea okayama7\|eukprot:XP_001833226.1 hypothetical protein CC1G_04205 [Coprinopsis cinerea okayama7\